MESCSERPVSHSGHIQRGFPWLGLCTTFINFSAVHWTTVKSALPISKQDHISPIFQFLAATDSHHHLPNTVGVYTCRPTYISSPLGVHFTFNKMIALASLANNEFQRNVTNLVSCTAKVRNHIKLAT